MTSATKAIGIILQIVAIPIIIVNIALRKMPNADMGISALVSIISGSMIVTGLILSHQQKKEVKRE